MSLPYLKMQGAGNQILVVDQRADNQPPPDPETIRRLGRAGTGPGFDQLMWVGPASNPAMDASYRVFNADGSEVEQCGNGARCVALYLELNGEYPGRPYTVEAPNGIVGMRRSRAGEYELDMGAPDFEPAAVPIVCAGDAGRYQLDSPWGPLELGAVSMGNPHSLMQVDDIGDERIPAIGAWLDAHEAFPDRVNAGFAQVLDRQRIRLRVVERGPGETLACGSGACAAVAILARWGLVGDSVDVFLPGGRLVIQWPGAEGPVLMKGPAQHVFRGKMDE